MSELVSVYVTCGGWPQAEALARTLVEEGLIACANIVSPVTSIYRWQGRVEKEQETLLFLKTVRSRLDLVRARIVELHDYDLPCVLALPIEAAHEPYARWVEGQVTPPTPPQGST